MLISKTVKMKWHNSNKEHYVNKGYLFTKMGDEFEIKIDHCTPSSCVEIEALCDYCLKQDKITVIKRKYRNYYKDQINGIIHTDACLNCASKKAKDIVNKKQELGLLTKKDSHYWFFYENRLHELKNIILDKRDLSEVLRKEASFGLINAIHSHKDNIIDMVHELGFKIYDVCLDTSAFYYQFKIEHIIFYLNEFIQEYGKFPSMAEIKTILHIDSNIILKFGGLFNIKQSMGIKSVNKMNYTKFNSVQIIDLTIYNNKSGIYKITNIINSKIYIGQAVDLWKRIRGGYIKTLPKGKCHNKHLQRAWEKYGAENFMIDVIEECTAEDLNKREQYWIDFYLSYDNKCGYNICKEAGSTRGRKDSAKEIERKRKLAIERNPMQGKTHTDQVKKILSEQKSIPIVQLDIKGNFIKEWASAKIAGDELNLKPSNISSTTVGKHLTCGGFIFCKKTEYENGEFDIQKVIYEKQHHHLAKAILQFGLEGNFIREWNSASEVSKQFNINTSTINAALNGRQKTTCGYIWRYK